MMPTTAVDAESQFVAATHFWQRAIPAVTNPDQPVLFIIDNAHVLARQLPVFIHDFRQLAASHRAGANLLLIGSEGLLRHKQVKQFIDLPVCLNTPDTDDTHTFKLHEINVDENEPVLLRRAFTCRAAMAARGILRCSAGWLDRHISWRRAASHTDRAARGTAHSYAGTTAQRYAVRDFANAVRRTGIHRWLAEC
ncbi:hypothetical protein [Enterobacter sp. ENT03]|uniref:hypothetical protein n=1 Tax=Enterobacter sp. ENT03 TaxID=2854780 RepID=UPI001C46269D|nr:hypothetical protein [Enterobacter sp. ENT03]MBV7407264.1 hypothetical protein [Enterobacter sp. ENT03]